MNSAVLEIFDAYLRDAGISSFSTKTDPKILTDGSGTSAPREMWYRIIPTLRIVQRIREFLDCPILVNSGYRCPAYNKQIGGEPGSQHMRFSALDIRAVGATPVEIYRAVVALTGRDFMRGFLGVGQYQNFIHIDTRGLTSAAVGAAWNG